MPVYNASAYLRESIDSILNQTFTDFELIIIDDGSKDNSVEIIKSYQDSRIRFYINDKNKGIVYTLNKGIDYASSEIIARMDADDISLPDRFEKQYNYLNTHPDCSLVCGWITIIDRDGNESFTQKRYTANLYFDMVYECTIPHPTVMFRKQDFQQIGGYRNVVAEDYDLWSRYIQKFKIVNIESVVLKYRKLETNLSTVLKDKNYLSTKNIVRENIKKLAIGIKLDENIIDWYLGNFTTVQNNRDKFLSSILSLKKIRNKLWQNDNPNCNKHYIRIAFKNKRNILLNQFNISMNERQKMVLLLLSGQFKLLIKSIIIKYNR